MKDRFEEMMEDLAEKLDLSLEPDSTNSYSFLIDEKLTVQLEADDENRLLIGSFISETPPGKFRELILKEALKENYRSQDSVFAYNEPTNQLVLFLSLDMEELTGEKLNAHLATFTEKALLWKEAIDAGRPAPYRKEK